jgi:hypothetical protein
MSNRYVYHFLAMLQLDNGNIKYVDGIAELEDMVSSKESYDELKKLIHSGDPSEVVISSLSRLGILQE